MTIVQLRRAEKRRGEATERLDGFSSSLPPENIVGYEYQIHDQLCALNLKPVGLLLQQFQFSIIDLGIAGSRFRRDARHRLCVQT